MKKAISLILCVLILLSSVPMQAMADEYASGESTETAALKAPVEIPAESEPDAAETREDTPASTDGGELSAASGAEEESTSEPAVNAGEPAGKNAQDAGLAVQVPASEELTAGAEPEEQAAFEKAAAREEETPEEALRAADHEMSVGESVSDTLNEAKPSATVRLTAASDTSLLLGVTGGVTVELVSEQDENRVELSGEKGENGEWQETTATFSAAAGTYLITVTRQAAEAEAAFVLRAASVRNEEPVERRAVRALPAASNGGFAVSLENEAASVSVSDSAYADNQAIRVAVGGNVFDALLDFTVTGLGSATEGKIQSETLKGQSALKYRVVRILSANEAEWVSGSGIMADGELNFRAEGDGTYVLVRLKGVELDPTPSQSSPAFYVELVSGATEREEDYVWTADNAAAGHRYIFRINYRLSVYTDQEADKVQMVIPEQILRDRYGDLADAIEFSIPKKEEVDKGGEISDDVFFAWRRETDSEGEPTGNIIIYNFRPLESGGRNGLIELAYATTKPTLDYKDYDPADPAPSRSDPFHCVLMLPDKAGRDSEQIPVCMDTTAKVEKVEKSGVDLYDTWQTGWGEPADYGIDLTNSHCQFLIWQVKTTVSLTQPFNLTIQDVPITEGLTPIALKWSGDSAFAKPDADGSWTKGNLRNGLIYASILTSVDESVYKLVSGEEVEKWVVQNSAIATVRPYDGVDPTTTATGEGSYMYEVPIFWDPVGHFDAWKRGDGAQRAYNYWGQYTTNPWIFNALDFTAGQYSRYDLDKFGTHDEIRGELESYDGLDYAVWMWGTPYVLTKDWNFSSNAEKNYGYFRDYIIYDQWDFDVKLGHSSSDLVPLGAGDYRIKQIQFVAVLSDMKLSTSSQSFGQTTFSYDHKIDEEDTLGGIGDVLHIYGKNGAGAWVELLRKDYREGGSTWVNSEYGELSNEKTLTLYESADHSKDIVLYRTVMKTRHAEATIGTVPEFELYPTETVLGVVDNAGTICLYNDTYADLYSTWEGQVKHVEFDGAGCVSGVYYTGNDYREYKWDSFSGMNIDLDDGDPNTYYRYFHIYDAYRRDFDYARSSQSDSYIEKRITGTSNDRKMARFTIGWQVDMAETITTSTGTDVQREGIPQDGGVFYDLLPKGAAVDQKTVKVLSAGGEVNHALELIPNWRGSGRTMMKVSVLQPGVNYSLSYETIHAWTSIKDYGSAVYNPVAYETGNENIAKGKADDASSLQFASAEERSWMANLDPASGDAHRFLYSESRTSISALIALSNGISKSVRALKDTVFRSNTYVGQSDVYLYRLAYAPDSQVRARNLLFIDNLEESNVAGRQWQGKLYSSDPAHPEYAVDVSQLKAAGATPTVYYADHVVDVGYYEEEQTTQEYLAARGFQTGDTFFAGHTLDDVKAVAIYCGDSFELKGTAEEPNKSVSIFLYMISPEYVVKKGNPYPATFNNFALAMRVGVSGEDGRWEYIPQTTITPDAIVYTRVKQDIPLKKISEEDASLVIGGVQFKLSGTSFYTGKQIELLGTTQTDGTLVFEDMERGSYILEEVACPKDWVLDKTPYQVVIDGYGRLWIANMDVLKTEDGAVQTDPESGKPLMADGTLAPDDYLFSTVKYGENVFTIENEPRIYTDFSFYKAGKRDSRPIPGVEFRLAGISHYNNSIEKTAISGADGAVSFEDVEWGTYTLSESQAAEGYRAIPAGVEIRVEIGGNRSVTIYELDPATGKAKADSEWVSLSRLGDVTIANPEKYTDIAFYKAEPLGESFRYLPGAKFSLVGTSVEGTEYDLEEESDETGTVRFTGIEEGVYELKETEAPKNIQITETGEAAEGGEINYRGDPNTYLVTVKADGTYTIRQKTASADGSSAEGPELGRDLLEHYVFLNTPIPEGEILITKKWIDGLTGTAAEGRPYPQLTLLTSAQYASNYYTVTFDAYGGYFPTGGKSYSLRYRADELPTAEQAASVPTPQRTNYVFDGWVYKLAGSDELHTFSLADYTEKATIVAYAKWKPARVWDYGYKGYVQAFTAPIAGDYLFEAWGANGGNTTRYGMGVKAGGGGAYTSGSIHLDAGQTVYVYVGGRGSNGWMPSYFVQVPGGWNGGGYGVDDNNNDECSGGGGGATDFRLTDGTWNSFASLKSRIMVAAGGGGPVVASIVDEYNITAFLGGQKEALPLSDVSGWRYHYKASISASGEYYREEGNSPVGSWYYPGAFGIGGHADNATYRNPHSIGGAGGGWYGGIAGSVLYGDSPWHHAHYGTSATGGTSYISGHDGCYAVDQASTAESITHLGTSEYAGFVFSDTVMLAGYELGTHTNPDTTGNGFARITYVASEDLPEENYPEQTLVPAGGSSGEDEEMKSLDSMEQTDGEGNDTAGYWEKTADDTWLYHFKVVNPKLDYLVYEDAGLTYARYGYHYVSEEMTPGYVELPGETTTATITNKLPTGSLNVTKHVAGGTSDQKFKFTVTLKDSGNRPVSGVFGGVSFLDGVGAFLLGDGENRMISEIPAGYKYEVAEEEVSGYAVSFDPETPAGTIAVDTVAEVRCTNSYTPPVLTPVNVTLKKVETGHFETAGTYTIRADFRNLTPNLTYSYLRGEERSSFTADENGEYNGLLLSMKHDDVVVFERLPVGSEYKFGEPGGEYTASYTIVDAAGGSQIAQSSPAAPVTGAALSTAWETANDGEQITVTFENRLERTVDLTVEKQVEGLDTGDAFAITLLITNLPVGECYTAVKGSDNPFVWTANENGEIIRTLTFTNGEKLVVRDLPVGTNYRVAEEVTTSYTPSVTVNGTAVPVVQTLPDEDLEGGLGIPAQTLHEGTDEAVVVKNTSATGSLKLTKRVAGNFGNRDTEFTFRITLTYLFEGQTLPLRDTSLITAEKNGDAITLTFTDGVCEVRLKDGDELLLKGIFDGVKYEIEETDSGTYRVSVHGGRSGTIRSNVNGGVTAVGFTNTLNITIPTGVSLTAVPGIAMAALGWISLVLLRRKKKDR